MRDASADYEKSAHLADDYEKGSSVAPHKDELSTESSQEEQHELSESPPEDEVSRQHNSTAADLSKVQSHRSTRSKFSLKSSAPTATAAVTDASSIPDGGLQAWLQVLGSFFLFFNSWGIINTFGVYQTFYTQDLLRDSNPAAIAWIGSVQSFLLGLTGPLCGPIFDAGYFRGLLMTGTGLIVVGEMMLSLSTKYWQVFLSQGICVGLGAGCLFVPSVAILSTYFRRHLATATGIAASGSSLGGTIYPIMVYHLIPRVGFGWTTRILGFLALATLLISNLVMGVRVLPAQKRKLVDFESFKEAPYTFFIVGGLVAFMGLYSVFVYIESFALVDKITTESLSFYSLAIINSASVFGRIIPNMIADRVGPLNVTIPATLISGILALCLIAVKDTAGLVVICLLYGFFSGALVSLPPTVYVSLSLHKRHIIGTRMGMGFVFFGVGLLLGTPIGGWILGASSFKYVWVFGGGLLIVASGLFFAARTAKVKGLNLTAKA